MDWFSIASTAAATIAIGLTYTLIGQSVNSSPDTAPEDKRRLRFGSIFVALALIVLLIPLAGIVLIVAFRENLGGWPSVGEWFGFLAVTGPFAVAGIYLALAIRNHSVVYSEAGLAVTSVLGIRREISWLQILELSHGGTWGDLYLHTAGGPLKVSHALKGYAWFLLDLEWYTGLDIRNYRSPYA